MIRICLILMVAIGCNASEVLRDPSDARDPSDSDPQCKAGEQRDPSGTCRCVRTNRWPVESAPTPRTLPDLTNIALGAAYTLDPPPNYALCTDPDDSAQLTDGVYTEGYFWTQASTVGWTKRTPLITMDLGADRPISGVSYNTAAGVADVHWPTAIHLFVAGTDEVFHYAGDLVALHHHHEIPDTGAYAVHRYWTDELRTHGRYLALGVIGPPFLFVDEIEVYGGEEAWLDDPIAGESVSSPVDAIRSKEVDRRVSERILSDMNNILRKAEALPVSSDLHEDILCEWDSVLETLEASAPGQDFRAVFPLNEAHQKVMAVQARLWREGGFSELTVWPAPTWEALPHLTDPPTSQTVELKLALMQQEYRAVQLNVTNAGAEAKQVRLHFEGLPGGSTPSYVSVHEAAWTGTARAEPVSTALPAATLGAGNYIVHVPSGMTRQVWLSFFLEDTPAGDYTGTVVIDGHSDVERVPISLGVYPFTLPAKKQLHLGGWDYTNRVPFYGVSQSNRAELVEHLVEHFVDRPWGTSSVMRSGSCDAEGHMTTQPDTSEFDAWLALWPDADRYQVYAAASNSICGHAVATSAFATAVGEWALFWSNHARDRGLSAGQLAVLLVDEPQTPEQEATILAWSRAIRQSGANMLVWEDPIHPNIQDADPEMIGACDVLCPNRQNLLAGGPGYAQYFAEQRAAGKILELYSCSGPVRLLDPYSYHRMQAWTAWQHGAEAMYFWAFADTGGASSWNEYELLSRNAHSPSFIDENSVTTSKHMEAVRQGIQDFEYLHMLREAIARARRLGVDAGLVEQAEARLDDLPSEVHPPADASIEWTAELDRNAADDAREEILRVLTSIDSDG